MQLWDKKVKQVANLANPANPVFSAPKQHGAEFIVFQVACVWITIQALYTFFHMSNKSKIDSILGADVLWKEKKDTNVFVYVDVRFECFWSCINIMSKWVFIQ